MMELDKEITPMSLLQVRLQISLILYVIPKWPSQELKVPQRGLPLVKGEHLEQALIGANVPTCTYLLEGQGPSFSHGWLKIFG